MENSGQRKTPFEKKEKQQKKRKRFVTLDISGFMVNLVPSSNIKETLWVSGKS
jgi:hypothetical protein